MINEGAAKTKASYNIAATISICRLYPFHHQVYSHMLCSKSYYTYSFTNFVYILFKLQIEEEMLPIIDDINKFFWKVKMKISRYNIHIIIVCQNI